MRPLIVHVVVEPFTEHVLLPGLIAAVNPVTVDVPSSALARQVSTACALPGRTDSKTGAPGIVRGRPTVPDDVVPAPAGFVATTFTV